MHNFDRKNTSLAQLPRKSPNLISKSFIHILYFPSQTSLLSPYGNLCLSTTLCVQQHISLSSSAHSNVDTAGHTVSTVAQATSLLSLNSFCSRSTCCECHTCSLRSLSPATPRAASPGTCSAGGGGSSRKQRNQEELIELESLKPCELQARKLAVSNTALCE